MSIQTSVEDPDVSRVVFGADAVVDDDDVVVVVVEVLLLILQVALGDAKSPLPSPSIEWTNQPRKERREIEAENRQRGPN